MNDKTQGTDLQTGRAALDRSSRTVAEWMLPFLLGGVALFSISALFYYHFHRVELEPTSFLQVAFAGLYDTFGWAPTVVFFLLVFAWSLIWFVTGVLERPFARLARLVVMAVMLGVFLNLGDGGVVQEPHKGAFGAWLAGRLVSAVGYLPSLVVVLVTTFASLLLATDWFFSEWFERSARGGEPESGVELAVTDHLRALADEQGATPAPGEAGAGATDRRPAPHGADVEVAALLDVQQGESERGAVERDEPGGPAELVEPPAAEDSVDAREDAQVIVLDPDEEEPDEIQLEVEVVERGGAGDELRVAGAPAEGEAEELEQEQAELDEDEGLEDEAELDADEELDEEEELDEDDEADEAEELDEDDEAGEEEELDEDDELDEEEEFDEDDEVEEDEELDEGDEVDDEGQLAYDGESEEEDEEEEELDADEESEEEQELDEDKELEREEAAEAVEDAGPRGGEDDVERAGAADGSAAVFIPRPAEPPVVSPPTPPSTPARGDRGRQQSLFGVGVDDGLVEEARALLASGRRPSASLLQRKLRIDYDLAQELLSELVSRGLLSADERR